MENSRTIEDIAYLIKQAKYSKENKPIIFLGAGASASAGIPLVDEIIRDILKLHEDKPSIKRLTSTQKKDYYELMSALSAQERRKLFSDYINSKDVKLNVTHIYLAQLLNEGYVDYILTVNFDDLMLKACALFNFIPPVYDISVLNDFTTTNFLEKSVTYLHGQHHGQWLLNAGEELSKVTSSVSKLFERICHNRTWIIVGYSGEDKILDEIAKIGSFENELYWIGFNEAPITDKVQKELFDKPRMNTYHIKGYDSDSFFLKLHSELEVMTPDIFNKPFSFLHRMMDQVTDIKKDDNRKHKDLFNSIKNRMEISRSQVTEAIETIERKHDENELIQNIIERIVKEDFSEIEVSKFEEQINTNNYIKAVDSLGNYYLAWGNYIYLKAEKLQDIELFEQSFNNYEKAECYLQDKTIAKNGQASALLQMGKIKSDADLCKKGIELLKFMLDEKGDDLMILSNVAAGLSYLAKINNSKDTFKEVFSQYDHLVKLYPQEYELLNDWAGALLYYYNICDLDEKEEIMTQILNKAHRSYDLGGNPYNLSCAYILLNDKYLAFKYLKEVLERKLVSVKFIETDSDWKNYSDDTELETLLSKYK